MSEAPSRRDGPTELVETEDGELLERLSGPTATLLLVWLIGVGALSTLLAAWTFVWIVSGERLGLGALFGGFGIYTALAGAAGPCVLWLAGRAQGHSLGWFMLTAAKIATMMVVLVVVLVVGATLVMAGALLGPGALLAAVLMAVMALALSQAWALATWGADRWIARARVSD
ncbi:MAG TPA: hypothetical protein VMP86_08740 [Candidatus Binatia bacterium]|nr:hypothetical protein [Candidatus Binatia bacterium]